MAAKFPYNQDSSLRRRAGFSLQANVKGAMARAIRRELKKQLFANRELVPCCFCGRQLTRQEATLEHVRPVSRGGPTELSNLKISCAPCNSERGDMGFEKFRGRKAQGRA